MIEKFNYNLFTIRSVLGDIRFNENRKINFISNSSSEIKNSTLFVPLKGNRDGHEFILESLSKGATAFLCEKNHPILKTLSPEEIEKAVFVDDTLLALGKLASFHRSRFAPVLIGITGSSGKTTTKELMGLICQQVDKKNTVVTEKNYNNEIGVPFTLFKINESTKIVVCEMGMNHKSEISRLTAMARPGIGVITNVGPCHIENLGSLENIARAKAEIIEGITEGGLLFLPKDISYRKIFMQSAQKRNIKVVNFAISKNENLKIEKIKSEGFELSLFEERINWKMPGAKILENLAAVVEVSKRLNIPSKNIQKGLSSYRAKDKRFVIEEGMYKVINDTYNANPDSMKSSLFALKQVASHNSYYAVLGDMKELGRFSKFYHLELGEFCKTLGLSGLISFGKDAAFITQKYFTKKTLSNRFHFIDSEEGIRKLISFIKTEIPKDSYILVKGSRSMKMERIVEGLKS